MRRKIGCALLVLCCLVLVAGAVLYRLYGFRTRLTRGGSGLATKPPPEIADRGPLASLPRYDPSSVSPHQVRLQGRDLRGLDLSQRLPDLLQANFDSHTQWPEVLPAGFDPARSLELGKNPGLGVCALHAKGITGRGVSIGIIDHRLLVDHVEYADRLRLYEELHSFEPKASMHGTAVASIAVGKTVGVAPEADLYYISSYLFTSNPLPWARMLSRAALARVNSPKGEATAEPEMDWNMVDFAWAARAIDRLLDLNRDLPAARKIRVISIEIGWAPGQPGYEEVTAALERAKKEGVFVISSSLRDTHGMRFHGLAREPMNDPEDPASYHPVTAWGPGLAEPTLLIPMDARTAAAPTGAGDYAFYRQGGWSWVAPYLAGLYALACQVDPDITPELFWKKALETGIAPDLSKLPPVSREAVREKMALRFDTSVAAAKKSQGEEEVKRQLMIRYQALTGEPAPKVSEAEFRDLLIELMTDDAMNRSTGREGRIVNPAALIEALRK
jgi:hypothetical protein